MMEVKGVETCSQGRGDVASEVMPLEQSLGARPNEVTIPSKFLNGNASGVNKKIPVGLGVGDNLGLSPG